MNNNEIKTELSNIAKTTRSREPGICPKCGSENFEYSGMVESKDDIDVYEVECLNCKSIYYEIYESRYIGTLTTEERKQILNIIEGGKNEI